MVPDITTVLGVTALNLFALSAALPMIMGKALSRAVRWVQASLLAQAGAWAAIVAAEFVWDMPLSVLAMVLGSLANYSVFAALRGWLGPRPYHRTMLVACIVMPVGYALSFDSYPIRVGWANGWLAVQLAVVVRAALWPVNEWGTQWRWLLAGVYSIVGLLTLARGLMGAFWTHLYPTFTAPHPVNVLAQLAANVAMPLTTVALLVAWRMEAEQRLLAQAHTDGLTDLPNRRGLFTVAPQLIAQAQRQRWSLAVVMLDLDHFKLVNDQYGHDGGDRSLTLFADVLRGCLRDNDVASRIGGEEFMLMLPHTDAHGVRLLDERLRAQLQDRSLRELGWSLNYSAGMVICPVTATDPLHQAMRLADEALYTAKRTGRGRLCESPAT